jgi:hypothetical protein
MLGASGVARSSVIHVTGPSGLSALLWLCRHGFEQVGYIRSGQACPREAPQALIVAHTCEPAWLERLLETGPHVGEGGVLIFRAAQPSDGGHGDRFGAVLRRHGYDLERRLQGAHRELCVARRRAALRKAA